MHTFTTYAHAVLQITSAKQYAPIHFILPHLKLNRTGGSTHWRRKYKTRPIRSTKSDRLTTRIRCGHNKQSEATRNTSARLCSSVGVGCLKGPPPLLLEDDRLTRTASPGVSFAPNAYPHLEAWINQLCQHVCIQRRRSTPRTGAQQPEPIYFKNRLMAVRHVKYTYMNKWKQEGQLKMIAAACLSW